MCIDWNAIFTVGVLTLVMTVARMAGFNLDFNPVFDWIIEGLNLPTRQKKNGEEDPETEKTVDAEPPKEKEED